MNIGVSVKLNNAAAAEASLSWWRWELRPTPNDGRHLWASFSSISSQQPDFVWSCDPLWDSKTWTHDNQPLQPPSCIVVQLSVHQWNHISSENARSCKLGVLSPQQGQEKETDWNNPKLNLEHCWKSSQTFSWFLAKVLVGRESLKGGHSFPWCRATRRTRQEV